MIRTLISLLAVLYVCKASAQSNVNAIEKELIKEYSRLLDIQFNPPENADLSRYDSLEAVSSRFGEKLLKFTSAYPATMTYPFDSLQALGITVVTSADKNFRIYSWDTWTGGTMHFFENVFQFRYGSQVQSMMIGSSGEDPKSWYSSIHMFNTGNRILYLGIHHSVGSTMDQGGGIRIFTIEKGKLNPGLRLIKTASGLQNEIHFYYNFMKVGEEENVPEARFDAKTKTILIPLINEELTPTGKFIRYQWNGKYFAKSR